MLRIIKALVDNEKETSLSARMRRKGLELLKSIIFALPKPVEILDVGGTQRFWEVAGLIDENQVHITVLNIEQPILTSRNLAGVAGDAKDLRMFHDKRFDVVFSNSVIEHVGSLDDQHKMAREIMRVGKHFLVQTPNRYFWLEPHFLVPFFQFLPLGLKAYLLRRSNLGWIRRERRCTGKGSRERDTAYDAQRTRDHFSWSSHS
jgi:SAM-dependent methyltransferase